MTSDAPARAQSNLGRVLVCKVAIVTGDSRGIGAATACAFARAGATLPIVTGKLVGGA